MAGVLPVNLPAFNAKTDIDQSTDLGLVYDYSAQQLKTRPISDFYRGLSTRPTNTFTINTLADFLDGYNCTISGSSITLQNAVYHIGGAIDLVASTLIMIDGTAIYGESAQSAQITSSATITIDTTAGAFVTSIINGPLRITTTHATGKAVNVRSGVFLIYDGAIIYASLAAQYGIYCMSGASILAINNYSMEGAATKLYAFGLTFGGIFTGLLSTNLGGQGLIFDGTSGVTEYGNMIFNECIISCTGASGIAVSIKGKSVANTSIVFNGSTFSSANDHAGYIESTVGGKFFSIQSIGTNFRNTVGGAIKHGINLLNAFFDVAYFTGGYITTKGTGASYAAAATPANIGSILAFNNIYLENTTTPANLTSTFTEATSKVDITNCYGMPDSGITGNLYVSAATGTFPATGVAAEIASVSINAVDSSSGLERCSIVVSDTTYRLKYTGLQRAKKSVSYTVSYSQGTASTITCTFELWGSTLGAIPGSATSTTLTATGVTAVTSVTTPINIPVNEELFLKVTSTATPTLTFKTLTISVS